MENLEATARRWAETWATAWPRGDADAIGALYRDDAAYRALAFRDADTPSAYLTRTLAQGLDVECRFGEPVVSGRRAAVEWWGSWVEDGRELTLAGVTVLTFDDDGKVVDHRDYWNEAPGRVAPYTGW